MPRLYYTCPDTNQPLGLSIAAAEVDEVADDWPHIAECPLCGEEHYLSLDQLHPDPNDGGDESGVREPRVPLRPDDEGEAHASR